MIRDTLRDTLYPLVVYTELVQLSSQLLAGCLQTAKPYKITFRLGRKFNVDFVEAGITTFGCVDCHAAKLSSSNRCYPQATKLFRVLTS